MTRSSLIGALAAGLLMVGVLSPAVAAASTQAGTSAASVAATTTTAASTSNPVPQGSSLRPDFEAQSLLFLPEILGQVDRHR